MLLLALAAAAAAQVCTHTDVSFYSKGNFKVRQVRIESPLDFMHAISSQLNALKPKLPLQPGSVFTLEASSQGRNIIEDALDALEQEDDPRSRVRVVLAGIDNCDENAAQPLLDVYYRVFTTNYNSYLSHTFEVKSDELQRPATAAATTTADTQTKSFVRVQPFVNYNRTRQLFGGVRAGLRMPGGVFDNMDVSTGASTAGNEHSFEMSGSRSPGSVAISQLEYGVRYKYSDLPAGDNRLRAGLVQAHFFGATSALGSKGVILRYGASLEGGNQQTDLESATGIDESQADSGYGGLKTYLGATLRTKIFSMAASYGLQLGARGASSDLDFVKHVGDAALNARWLLGGKPGEFHKAITLEAQLTGGAIKTLGALPVAQRFFGGNVARDFIEGDTWRIRSGPFIRSIPENRLNSGSTLGPIGGTGFYSANLTLALPVWGYPLVPPEMAKDPEFPGVLASSKETARKLLVFRHLNDIPTFNSIIAGLKPVRDELKELDAAIGTLPWPCPSDPPDDRPDIQEETCSVKDLVTILGQQLEDENKGELPGKLGDMLKAGDASPTCVDDETCSRLKMLRAGLESSSGLLRPAGFTQVADTFDRVRNSLETQQPPLAAAFNVIEASPEKQEAERLGTEDMKQLEAVLDTFINELNWIAVSPVAVFDVARLWPDRNGTRFGLGGGVRLSVVNFNMTVGYAFNPNPKVGEGRGAVFFSMDVTDLFR